MSNKELRYYLDLARCYLEHKISRDRGYVKVAPWMKEDVERDVKRWKQEVERITELINMLKPSERL